MRRMPKTLQANLSGGGGGGGDIHIRSARGCVTCNVTFSRENSKGCQFSTKIPEQVMISGRNSRQGQLLWKTRAMNYERND